MFNNNKTLSQVLNFWLPRLFGTVLIEWRLTHFIVNVFVQAHQNAGGLFNMTQAVDKRIFPALDK